MVEWGHSLRNVGLQHKILPWIIEHYCGKGGRYGRAHTVGMGIHKHYDM
jgi:hypothetical protein